MENVLLKEFEEYIKTTLLATTANNISTADYMSFLMEHNLIHLLSDSIKEYSQFEYLKVLTTKMILKNLKESLKEELLKLIDYCEKNKVDILLLKGFSIKDYDKKNIRFFHDIDLVFKKDQLNQLLEYFRDNGYLIDYDINQTDPFSIVTPLNESYYHIGVHKDNITFELHNNLFVNTLGYDFSSQFIWENTEKLEIDSKTIAIMEKKKNLLHILLHFLKDYKYYINENLNSNINKKMNLTLFFDVAYMCNITLVNLNDWSEFIDLAIKRKVLFEVTFVLKMINTVFPLLVPNEIVNEYLNKNIEHINRIANEMITPLENENFNSLISNNFYEKIRKHIETFTCKTISIYKTAKLNTNTKFKMNPLSYYEEHPKLIYKDSKINYTDFKVNSSCCLSYTDDSIMINLKFKSNDVIDLNALKVEINFITPNVKKTNKLFYKYCVLFNENIPSMFSLDYVTLNKLNKDRYSIMIDNSNLKDIFVNIEFKPEFLNCENEILASSLFNLSVVQKTNKDFDIRYKIVEGYWQSINSYLKLKII